MKRTHNNKRKIMIRRIGVLAVAAFAVWAATPSSGAAQAQQQPMGFFVTSVGMGDGANLEGLDGADQHCQSLAAAVGSGDRTWRAYLSAGGTGAQPPVNARDRIGEGPWFNANGARIAWDVADLHGDHQRTATTSANPPP
jgi:hypothetical protein